jgi:hypothetical protein
VPQPLQALQVILDLPEEGIVAELPGEVLLDRVADHLGQAGLVEASQLLEIDKEVGGQTYAQGSCRFRPWHLPSRRLVMIEQVFASLAAECSTCSGQQVVRVMLDALEQVFDDSVMQRLNAPAVTE